MRTARNEQREKFSGLPLALWLGFWTLGDKFGVWLQLAVNGVIAEKEGDDVASIPEVARAITESGVLDFLDIELKDIKTLEYALYQLRKNPRIVPHKRRQYLQKQSWHQAGEKVGYLEASHKGTNAEKIGGMEVVQELLTRDESWLGARLNFPYIHEELKKLGLDLGVGAAKKWLQTIMKTSGLAEAAAKRRLEPREWTPEYVVAFALICQELSLLQPGERFDRGYIRERFQQETGITLNVNQIDQQIKKLRRDGFLDEE